MGLNKLFANCRPTAFYFLSGVASIATMINIWSTVGIAVERYLIICHNYKSKKIYLYILPIVLGSLLLNMPTFFIWKMDGSTVRPSQFGLSKAIRTYYLGYVLPTFIFFLPVILFFILNTTILLKIWRLRRNFSHMTENNRLLFSDKISKGNLVM